MDAGLHVDKYQVMAKLGSHGVSWRFAVRTEDGEQHDVPLQNQADVPVLLELVRGDESIFYDPQSRTLTTGWNNPGS